MRCDATMTAGSDSIFLCGALGRYGGNETALVWITKGRSVIPFLNSCLLYALVFSDGSGTTLHRNSAR